MTTAALRVGFVPLLDMAPLAIAQEIGFAREEGLALELLRAPSWSMLRDMLVFGQVEAAQMLAPIPVAIALGLGGAAARLDVLQVLSLNGDVMGVSNALAEALRARGYGFDFVDAQAARKALRGCAPRVRFGAPFPFSTHAELIYRWWGEDDRGLELCTVPPPMMAGALAAGEIDAFCVGEPWGSMAVERGAGALLLPGRAIWGAAPEKVLTVRHDWAEAEPELAARLMRAVWRAARWLAGAGNRATACEILSRAAYLDLPAELLDRGLGGQLVISASGEVRVTPRLISYFEGAATFPWRSQAAWFAVQLARRFGLDPAASAEAAKAVFRTDLYRRNLREAGADLPGASEKLEGSLTHPTAVASERGELILAPDRFFDGVSFDPAAI